MHWILILGVAMIMAVISFIAIVGQAYMIRTGQTDSQQHNNRIPLKDSVQLAVVKSESETMPEKRSRANR
jgi:hypothetical protein